MRRRRLRALAVRAVAVLVLAACAVRPAPVPVTGAASDIAALAGAWSGEYRSDATRRTGSIEFTLAAGADTAFGDVLMIPSGSRQPYERADDGAAPAGARGATTAARPAQLLRVSVVRAQGGRVLGRLEPYLDPDCGCSTWTTFDGRLDGNRIVGTFAMRRREDGPPVATGEWSVSRR
ncbi:MAG TPA: hypothetical protein VNA89_00035 [Gemmatimonadaceae bacterium]|nr:hypothetical protein [Gemmatimonadaceae bacterium]